MPEKDELIVVWTTRDREVAENMVFMYTHNSKRNNWWSNVELIIWGPSSELLANDKQLQERISELKDSNVKIKACKACAERYGVVKELKELGIHVYYIGEELTKSLKDDNKKVLTI